MEPPIIVKSNPDDVPIIWVTLTNRGHTEQEKMLLAKTKIKDQLQVVPGVGEIFLSGFVERTINIYLDPSLLARYELTVDDIVDALNQQNLEVPAGRIENTEKEISVRAIGSVSTA